MSYFSALWSSIWHGLVTFFWQWVLLTFCNDLLFNSLVPKFMITKVIKMLYQCNLYLQHGNIQKKKIKKCSLSSPRGLVTQVKNFRAIPFFRAYLITILKALKHNLPRISFVFLLRPPRVVLILPWFAPSKLQPSSENAII